MNGILVRISVFIMAMLGVICPCMMRAQLVLPEQGIARHQQEDVLIRWEPGSLAEWRATLKVGSRVQLLDQQGKVIHEQLMKPFDAGSYIVAARASNPVMLQYYDACMGLLYPEQSGSGKELQSMMEHMIQNSDQTIDSFKLSMLSFYSSFNMDLAQANGLGLRVKDVSNSATHCVITTEGYAPFKMAIRNDQPAAPVPSLIATWGDHYVRFSWKVENLYQHFMGYQIERSADGEKYASLHELPILDPAVGIDGDKTGVTMGYGDSLSINYKDFYYRLKTVDYFGLVSVASSMVKGYGFEGIRNAANFTYADQADHNQAHLKWNLDNTEVNKIQALVIMQSSQMEANYEPIDTVDKYLREIKVPMAFEVNYYRIDIIPVDGKVISGFPVFVMGLDTIAPTTPVVIQSEIDTLGHIVISWKPNTESDLWGYKVFKSNFATDEYALQTKGPIPDTVFIDSVSLRLGTQNVYYVLQAVDKRNNRSAFTEPIVLAKPDIIPPGGPILDSLRQNEATILIHWTRSGSADVVKYQLFRRLLDTDEQWKLVAELDSMAISPFMDNPISYNHRYAYSMRAQDDAALFSDMAPMKVISTVAPVKKFEPNILTNIQYNRELKGVELGWTSNEPERVSSVLIYRGWSEEQLGKYKFGTPGEASFTDLMNGSAEVYYKLKITYEDDPMPYYSETMHVTIPKPDK